MGDSWSKARHTAHPLSQNSNAGFLRIDTFLGDRHARLQRETRYLRRRQNRHRRLAVFIFLNRPAYVSFSPGEARLSLSLSLLKKTHSSWVSLRVLVGKLARTRRCGGTTARSLRGRRGPKSRRAFGARLSPGVVLSDSGVYALWGNGSSRGVGVGPSSEPETGMPLEMRAPHGAERERERESEPLS